MICYDFLLQLSAYIEQLHCAFLIFTHQGAVTHNVSKHDRSKLAGLTHLELVLIEAPEDKKKFGSLTGYEEA